MILIKGKISRIRSCIYFLFIGVFPCLAPPNSLLSRILVREEAFKNEKENMKHQYQYLYNASHLKIMEGDTANWYTTRHKINRTYVIKSRFHLQVKIKTADGRLQGHC